MSDFPDADPIAVVTVKRSFYVDDCLRSVASKEEAITVVHGTKDLLAKGGFRLTKFVVMRLMC